MSPKRVDPRREERLRHVCGNIGHAFKNLEADGTVTVTIIDKDNPWRWSEIRGRVVETIAGPEGRAHIDELAQLYMGVDVYPNPIVSERVKIVIEPEYVFDFPPSG